MFYLQHSLKIVFKVHFFTLIWTLKITISPSRTQNSTTMILEYHNQIEFLGMLMVLFKDNFNEPWSCIIKKKSNKHTNRDLLLF